MSRDFYELCYDQYKYEMSESERLYQKAGVMLVVLPVLGAIITSLGRLDIFTLRFARWDVFAFYLSSVLAFLALVISAVFLFACVYPREYKTLADMDVWQKWREEYLKYLSAREEEGGDTAARLDAAMLVNLCPRLVEAQPVNAQINESRRKAFKKSVKWAAIASVAVGVQGLFNLILRIQGV